MTPMDNKLKKMTTEQEDKSSERIVLAFIAFLIAVALSLPGLLVYFVWKPHGQ